MVMRTWLATALALLATVGIAVAASVPSARAWPDEDLRALEGAWLYVEDRTEGRAVEEQQPPMSVTFRLRLEPDAVVMVRGNGREERIALDGTTTEVAGTGTTKLYRGEWKRGVLEYEVTSVRDADGSISVFIRREFRITPEGLLARVVVGDPAQLDSVALYRHPEDIPLPEPARAAIGDLGWLAGAWVGTRGSSSIEERWSPPLGGAMLGVSRTVQGDSMVGFEYLRVVERNGGLVYVAQPGGSAPTEFVLTDWSRAHAVFENPRHDSPQRIAYELSDDGSMSASIGFVNGGRPQRFEFTRESD